MVRELQLNGQLYLMIVPIVAGFVVFRFVPMTGLVIAFKDYNFVDGLFASPWVGLDNFPKIFSDPFFVRVITNTLVLGVLTLVVTFPLPILFALALNEVRHSRFKASIQSISYLPHFVSTVVIVGILLDFFSSTGIVNQMLTGMGLPSARFLSSVDWFRPLYLLSYIWANVGWASILYLAALSSIPSEQQGEVRGTVHACCVFEFLRNALDVSTN